MIHTAAWSYLSRFSRHFPGVRQFRALLPTALACLLVQALQLHAQSQQEAIEGVVVSEYPAPLADVLEITEPDEDLLLARDGRQKADAIASYMMALIYEESAETGKMIAALQKTLDLDPGRTDLAVKLAFEYIRIADVPAGIGVLKDAVKFDPSNPRPYLHLATIYFRSLQKFDLAEEYALKAREIAPGLSLVYQALFEIYASQGKMDNARSVLSDALAAESDDPEFWLSLGEMFSKLLPEDRIQIPEDQMVTMNALYEKALENGRDNVMIINAVADHYILSKQVDKAIPLYLEILKEKSGATDSLLANVREKLARTFLVSGQRDEAIRILEEMARTQPMRAETYEFLGQLYEESGENEKALANYEQVLLIQPKEPLNYLKVAEVYVRLGKHDKAIEILESGREAFPQIPQMTYSLAIAYTQAKMFESALETYELALSEEKIHGEQVAGGGFYFNYGIAAEGAGEIDLAMDLFKKAVELDPANAAPALNYLGYMLVVRRENLNEAEAFISRALEIDPENGAYIDSLGWLYYQRGEYRKALAELLRAEKRIDPEEPANYEIYDHLGDIYLKLENFSEAIHFWNRAVQLANEDKPDIQSKIDKIRQVITSKQESGEPKVGEPVISD